jgi:uncharacterized protein YcfJ
MENQKENKNTKCSGFLRTVGATALAAGMAISISSAPAYAYTQDVYLSCPNGIPVSSVEGKITSVNWVPVSAAQSTNPNVQQQQMRRRLYLERQQAQLQAQTQNQARYQSYQNAGVGAAIGGLLGGGVSGSYRGGVLGAGVGALAGMFLGHQQNSGTINYPRGSGSGYHTKYNPVYTVYTHGRYFQLGNPSVSANYNSPYKVGEIVKVEKLGNGNLCMTPSTSNGIGSLLRNPSPKN